MRYYINNRVVKIVIKITRENKLWINHFSFNISIVYQLKINFYKVINVFIYYTEMNEKEIKVNIKEINNSSITYYLTVVYK